MEPVGTDRSFGHGYDGTEDHEASQHGLSSPFPLFLVGPFPLTTIFEKVQTFFEALGIVCRKFQPLDMEWTGWVLVGVDHDSLGEHFFSATSVTISLDDLEQPLSVKCLPNAEEMVHNVSCGGRDFSGDGVFGAAFGTDVWEKPLGAEGLVTLPALLSPYAPAPCARGAIREEGGLLGCVDPGMEQSRGLDGFVGVALRPDVGDGNGERGVAFVRCNDVSLDSVRVDCEDAEMLCAGAQMRVLGCDGTGAGSDQGNMRGHETAFSMKRESSPLGAEATVCTSTQMGFVTARVLETHDPLLSFGARIKEETNEWRGGGQSGSGDSSLRSGEGAEADL
jgi:hypothetical protein